MDLLCKELLLCSCLVFHKIWGCLQLCYQIRYFCRPKPAFGALLCSPCNTLNVLQSTVRCTGLCFHIGGNDYGQVWFCVSSQTEPATNFFFSPFGHRTAIGKLAVLPYVARIRCAVDKRALCHHRVTYLHTALSCMTFHAVVVQKTEQEAMQSSGCYEVLDSLSYKMLEAMQNSSNTRCYRSLHFGKRTCLLEGLLSQVRWLKRRSFHCFQIPSCP